MRLAGRWLLLCVTLLTLALPAWAAPSVDLSVQAANDGRVKQGGWVTVLVDLQNQGAELSGELVVEVGGDFPHSQYVVPVTLPAGGRKRIPVSLRSLGSSPLAVGLYAGGERVAFRSVSLTLLPPQATMVGVLTGDEQGIPALSYLEAFQGQTAQVVRLNAGSLPDRAALLESFNLIALSRFDTASLKPEQLRALEIWVERGGTLLLAGGPEWKRTLAQLPPALLPVQVTGVREVALDPLSEVAGKPLSGAGAVSTVRIIRGQSLLNSGETPLIVRAPVGSGQVIFLAFDPGLTPIAGWAGQAPLYNRLLGGAAVAGITQHPTEQEWMLQEALRRIPDWGLPGVWSVALLLISYLLLIGPVNYLLLKRMDRREWGWVSVPALSLLFVIGVYGVGFGRFRPIMSHLITITELSPEGGAATMSAHLGVYAPSRSRLTIPVGDGRLIQPFLRGGGMNGEIIARVATGEATTVELLQLNNYSMSGFSMERDLAVSGGLALTDSRLEGGSLTARLKNSLPLAIEGVRVAAGSSYRAIGRIEPGQQSEPFTLDLSRAPVFDPKMGQVPAPIGPNGPAPEGADQQRRQLILDYLAQSLNGQGGSGVLVSGWTAQPLEPVALPELGKMAVGANLVYARLPLPMGDSAWIPPGVIKGRPTDPKSVEWVPNGYMLQPGSHSFTLLLPPLETSRVAALELYLGTPAPPVQMGLKVAVKNQKRGDWLPLESATAKLSGWEEYVSPVGLLELRYESAQHVEVQPPTVAVLGVER